MFGKPYCVQVRLGPIQTNKPGESWQGDGQIQVGNRALLVPLRDLLPNVIWCLEQVSRESSESMMLSWDSGESGNMCKSVKW